MSTRRKNPTLNVSGGERPNLPTSCGFGGAAIVPHSVNAALLAVGLTGPAWLECWRGQQFVNPWLESNETHDQVAALGLARR